MTRPEGSGGPGNSPGALMADVLAGLSRLVQGEIALARAMAVLRLRSVARAAGLLAVAGVVGITAANVLAGAAVTGIVAMGLAPHWATLLVGGVLLVSALLLARYASGLMQAAGAMPQRSADNLRRDVETLHSMVKSDATA